MSADKLAAALEGLTERQATNVEIATNICNGIRDRLVEQIRNGTVPEEWDGHEIRQLVADNATRCTSSAIHDRRSKRYRQYEMVCLTTPGLR